MAADSARSTPSRRLAKYLTTGLLAATLAGLAAGAIFHAVGLAAGGDLTWLAVGAGGLVYAVWAMAYSLLHHRLGVDLLAVYLSLVEDDQRQEGPKVL